MRAAPRPLSVPQKACGWSMGTDATGRKERQMSTGAKLTEGAQVRSTDWTTPLLEVTPPFAPAGVVVLAKMESMNPGLSVKDRVASFGLTRRLRDDPGLRDGIFVEASSGNTAVGLALAAARMGVRAWLFVPASAGAARIARIRRLGARLTVTPAREGTDGAQRRAGEAGLLRGCVYLNQHASASNPAVHVLSTGPEIWKQSGGLLDGFAAAVGTGGTLLGAGGYIRRRSPGTVTLGAVPARGERIPGIRRLDPQAIPLHRRLGGIGMVGVSRRRALELSRWVADRRGFPVGPSSGAALEAALRLGAELGGGVVATVFPDHGFNYI